MGFPRIPTHVSGLPGKATSGEEAAAYESGGMGTVLSDWLPQAYSFAKAAERDGARQRVKAKKSEQQQRTVSG